MGIKHDSSLADVRHKLLLLAGNLSERLDRYANAREPITEADKCALNLLDTMRDILVAGEYLESNEDLGQAPEANEAEGSLFFVAREEGGDFEFVTAEEFIEQANISPIAGITDPKTNIAYIYDNINEKLKAKVTDNRVLGAGWRVKDNFDYFYTRDGQRKAESLEYE